MQKYAREIINKMMMVVAALSSSRWTNKKCVKEYCAQELGQSAGSIVDVEKNRGRNGSAPETMSKRIARLAALSS